MAISFYLFTICFHEKYFDLFHAHEISMQSAYENEHQQIYYRVNKAVNEA